MLVLCCGSRNWRQLPLMQTVLSRILTLLNQRFVVLHGGASGADSVAGIAAGHLGLDVEIKRPAWHEHGKAAGMIRNTQMLERKPDYVIAFWDGKSRGTLDTIQKAVNTYRIPVLIVRENE